MSADTKIPSLSSQVKSLQPAVQWARRVADQINMVSPIRGGPGVSVAMVPGVGTTIGVDPVKRGRRILGIIVATGPGGAADYTDARYWWQEAYLHQLITENMSNEARPVLDDAAVNASAQTLTNLSEAAGSTHTLTAGTLVWVDAVEGRIDSGTVNQFYQFTTLTSRGNGSTGVLTPLTTIGGNTEGTETADTSTWTRGSHAMEVWAVSRVVYNDAGDKVLYAFVRKWTYDTLGCLYSISAETRISVDVTDACP